MDDGSSKNASNHVSDKKKRTKISWKEASGDGNDGGDNDSAIRESVNPGASEESKRRTKDSKKNASNKQKNKKTEKEKKHKHETKKNKNAVQDQEKGEDGNVSPGAAERDGFVIVDLENEMEELVLQASTAPIGGNAQARRNARRAQLRQEARKKKQSEATEKRDEDEQKMPGNNGQSNEHSEKKPKKEKQKTKNTKSNTAPGSLDKEGTNSVATIVDQKKEKKNKKVKKDPFESSVASYKINNKSSDMPKHTKESLKREQNKKGAKLKTEKPTIVITEEIMKSINVQFKSRPQGDYKTNQNKDEPFPSYEEYMDRDVVMSGLEDGSFLQGKLRVNNMYRMDGYITVDGVSVDVLVTGMKDRNRAMDGDLIAIQLHPEAEWKPLGSSNDRLQEEPSTSPRAPPPQEIQVDTKILHSLWLPSVATEKCFLAEPVIQRDDPVNALKRHIAAINEKITQLHRRPTAKVVFVLADGNKNGFIGSLEPKTKVTDINASLSSDDGYAYFNAHDLRLPRRIQIPRLQLPDEFISRPLLYSKTMLCFCRVKSWPTKSKIPKGEFVKTVGEYTGIESGISATLSKNGLLDHTLDFSSDILEDLDSRYGISGENWQIPPEEIEKRRDFRLDAQIFSIDPYNARDLDDALHIRALNDARTKFEIGVHIADVTHFIEKGSLLDKEAQSRATSVYLANRVLPMLPRILCEKLCSLQPQVDRLAFSIVWQMNLDGSLVEGVKPWFGKSIICSCCKLDYGTAQKMLDGTITSENVDEWEVERQPIPGDNPMITNASVIQSVKDLWAIGKNRRAMRFNTGAISLNDVKLVFSLDIKGNPTSFGSYVLKDSNRLVEEYMLLANYLVAQQLLHAHGPLAFLRHHPCPVGRAMESTVELLKEHNLELNNASTKALSDSLAQIFTNHGDTTFAMVQALLIKPMRPAEYMVAGNGSSPEAWRHYALNIPYYTHFTSPIRRYADVVVHRLLQESAAKEEEDESANDFVEIIDLEEAMRELSNIAHHCNEKKMTAKNAEKECDQVFLCAYVKHHGSVEVTGVVMSMGPQSFTVHVLDLGLEQRLFLKDLNLTGVWDENTSSLSIQLPARGGKKKKANADVTENRKENEDEQAEDELEEKKAPCIQLSFMKQLRLRMSATKKMPLALKFSVIGEKF